MNKQSQDKDKLNKKIKQKQDYLKNIHLSKINLKLKKKK
ncbi:uncharacterized protein METZ01_LOCUS316288 [marine metagenome]|uniref:Uncharacterized protein n=1 Tax=marine metagenome TaxID=408172 RepID=A0A382NQH7_9ZZZZ